MGTNFYAAHLPCWKEKEKHFRKLEIKPLKLISFFTLHETYILLRHSPKPISLFHTLINIMTLLSWDSRTFNEECGRHYSATNTDRIITCRTLWGSPPSSLEEGLEEPTWVVMPKWRPESTDWKAVRDWLSLKGHADAKSN